MPRVPAFRLILASSSLLALSAVGAGAQAVKETVHLVIVGGPNAGTYDATGTRGGCSAGITGPGSWGNQLSAPAEKDPAKFNSLQLVVPDAAEAAKGTAHFQLIVGFGPLLHRSAEYKVDTRASASKQYGHGTVTVHDGGTTGKVTFDAVTENGVRLQGTIDCKSVLRATTG